MKRVLYVVVLFLIAIVAVGFFRNWFRVSTENVDGQRSATITMEKDKIRADDQKVTDALQGFEQEAKNKVSEPAAKVQEPARRP